MKMTRAKARKLLKARAAAESLEDVIRMATRVQTRLRTEGIGLAWTLHFAPVDPEPQLKRGPGGKPLRS